jgi:hypothetical protein
MAAKSLREAFEKIPTWAWLVAGGIAIYLLYRKMSRVEKAVLSGQSMGGLSGMAVPSVVGPVQSLQPGLSAGPAVRSIPPPQTQQADDGKATDLSGVVNLQDFEEFR